MANGKQEIVLAIKL